MVVARADDPVAAKREMAKSLHRLLASLCNALDVPGDGFGDPKYAGTLPELR